MTETNKSYIHKNIFTRKPKDNRRFGRHVTDERIIFKWILEKNPKWVRSLYAKVRNTELI
jgi:hypothetical protein